MSVNSPSLAPLVAPPEPVGTPVAIYGVADFPAAPAGSAVSAQAATTQAARKPDLDVSIKSGAVAPTQAPDLNLLHVFGGEKLTIPTVVKNYGPGSAVGSVTVTVYLSTTRDLSASSVRLGAKTVNVNLINNATQAVSLDVTVPTTLTAGNKYYIIAKITTPIAQSTINDVRTSDRQFEFVGTPTHTAPFRPDAQGHILYFDLIRKTLNGDLVIQDRDPAVRFNDPKAFIAHWEGDKLYPYMDGNAPTIGTDVKLDNLAPNTARILATAVRNYYRTNYGQQLSNVDAEVINMLKTQARSGSTKPALAARDTQSLFNADYAQRQQAGINALGQTAFSRIDPTARIAVMDLVYATGTVPTAMVAPLKAGDYVRAGFELINSPRSTQNPLLAARTQAEFQNLLFSKRSVLGGVI
jgi:hypothetical protein